MSHLDTLFTGGHGKGSDPGLLMGPPGNVDEDRYWMPVLTCAQPGCASTVTVDPMTREPKDLCWSHEAHYGELL